MTRNAKRWGPLKMCVHKTGAVASPQLLMLSGVGSRASLERVDIHCVVDSPGVGQNVQDHLFVAVNRQVPVSCAVLCCVAGMNKPE